MLQIVTHEANFLHYRLSGKISHRDIDRLFAAVDPAYRNHGKLRLLAEAHHFRGYTGPAALWSLLRHEPTLLWKVERYALVTEQAGLAAFFRLMGNMVPAVKIRVFQDVERAREWLTEE